MKDDIITTNPSYVTVQFNRFTTSPGVMMNGSTIRHSHGISLHISKAEEHRYLHSDHVFGNIKDIIEVWLSPMQFADLLTQMNVGTGVPGTMIYHNGKKFDCPSVPSKSEQFKKETKERVDNIVMSLKRALSLATKYLDKQPTKSERKEMVSAIKDVESELHSGLPFLMSQFSEQMEKTVTDAKASVDAFVDQAVLKTGLKTLLENNKPQIED